MDWKIIRVSFHADIMSAFRNDVRDYVQKWEGFWRDLFHSTVKERIIRYPQHQAFRGNGIFQFFLQARTHP